LLDDREVFDESDTILGEFLFTTCVKSVALNHLNNNKARMNTELLAQIYENSTVVKAICDHMGNRLKNQSETLLHRMLAHLERDGFDVRRGEVIHAFRRLEEAECGRYIEGRHGWKSRFVWSVKSRRVAAAAVGLEAAAELEADDEAAESADDDMIDHSYVLRPDLSVSFDLPADLTRNEAERLATFIGSLSFEE
jgi:hypothetical protein